MPNEPLPNELQELLAKPNPAVISSIREDGSPHSAPTWYDVEGGRVLVNSRGTPGRKRLRYRMASQG